MKKTAQGPLHQQIRAHLQELLDGYQLRPGDQVPSERKLMALFNASNMPVRQAIQHFIDKGIFARIHGRGTFVVNQASEHTGRIAVLYVYDNAGMWSSPFYTEIMRGIEHVTIEEDQRLIMQSVGDNDIYSLLCKMEDEVDGFLILDLFPSMCEKVEKYVREKRKDVVVINYPHHWNNVDSVLTDNVGNAQSMTQYLIQNGHRQIMFLYQHSMMGNMRELHPSYELKRQGYRQALELADIPYNEKIVLDWSSGLGEQLGSIIRQQQVSAIFCSGSHLVQQRLIPILEQNRMRIPKDISIVAYDRTRDILQTDVPIACIDTPLIELGQASTKRLNEKIHSKFQSSSTLLIQGQVLKGASVLDLKGTS